MIMVFVVIGIGVGLKFIFVFKGEKFFVKEVNWVIGIVGVF